MAPITEDQVLKLLQGVELRAAKVPQPRCDEPAATLVRRRDPALLRAAAGGPRLLRRRLISAMPALTA